MSGVSPFFHLQNEKRKMLMEHETQKLKQLDEEHSAELREWKANLKPRKQVRWNKQMGGCTKDYCGTSVSSPSGSRFHGDSLFQALHRNEPSVEPCHSNQWPLHPTRVRMPSSTSHCRAAMEPS